MNTISTYLAALTAALCCVICGCAAPAPEPVPPQYIDGVDFLARDLVLDLSRGEDRERQTFREWVLVEGWGQPGAEGTWGTNRRAVLQASIAPEVDHFWIKGYAYRGLDGPLTIEVWINKQKVGDIDAGTKSRWHGFDMPPRDRRRSLVTVELRFSRSRSPRDAGLGSDPRSLAFFVKRMAFVAGKRRPNPSAGQPAVSQSSSGLQVNQAGRVLYNLDIETPFTAVDIAMRMSKKAGDSARVSIWQPESGRKIAEAEFTRDHEQTGPLRLDIDPRLVSLQIAVDVEGPVEDLTVLAHRAAEPAENSARETAESSKIHRRPDVFVFVLDASRADHFGRTYAYDRDTVPSIDRMAREALVFNRVYAQAPYTSCSVPTMFTGLGYTTHQVVANKDRLSDDEQTLAERLKAAGYRTIGLTATPNNSIQLGMAQGFDEFVELWRGTDWATSINPNRLADKAVGIINEGLGEDPVFMMMHLVPPHSPYTPPEEHRVWNTAGYTGPCDGSIEYLNRIRGHSDTVSSLDMNELLALYDGNMRFCDAAVDRIFTALENAGRFEDALILVTSDHGEAFFEHGKLDHNSTVYDEMLQVPFVLRLPGGKQPDGIDLDRLASLEDLVPTVLGRIGLALGERRTGVDLLGDSPRRSILHRSATQQNIHGFRYGRWKLISDRRGVVSELYDLANDIGEQENLLVARPDIVSWIIAAWQSTLESEPKPFETGEREISDADREMLEQLGYLDG